MPHPVPRRAAALVAALTAAGCVLALAPAADATSTAAQITTSKNNGVAYVRSLQSADGSFVTSGLSNEWAFSALAAAGTAAVDVTPSGDASRNARTVYRAQVAASSWPNSSPTVTDYERGLINTYSAGIDPARVGVTRNLVADVLASWQPANPGYFGPPSNFNGTVFALLALAGGRTTAGVRRVPASLLTASIGVVRANEHNDGGWDFGQAAGNANSLAATSDIDMTGAALAALCSSGVSSSDAAVTAGVNFLKGKLVAGTGAFASSFGANTDSNGWAVSGLNACGIAAQGTGFTTSSNKTPIDFLLAQQLSNGGFRYQPANTAATAYSSIDALRAVAGGGFVATPPTPATSGAAQWVATTAFTSGTASPLGVVVDTGAANGVTACRVTVTPTATTSTLGAVLDAAASTATPSGCVTGAAPTSGTGQITALNGRTDTSSAVWRVSIDGAAAATATRGTVIRPGDTVSLSYS